MTRPVVLVIRKDDRFSAQLRDEGCEVLDLELIRAVPVTDLSGLDKTLRRIDDYDGLFFTSPISAAIFAERSKSGEFAYSGRAYALGERAKTVLEDSGVDVVYRREANTAADLIASFGEAEFRGKRLLFVRGDKSQRTIPDLLGPIANVDEIVVYQTTEVQPDHETVESIKARFARGDIDWVCFFSPSGVESFRRLFDHVDISGSKIAAIGETTAAKAKDLQMSVDLISERANADDFAAQLIGQIKKL